MGFLLHLASTERGTCLLLLDSQANAQTGQRSEGLEVIAGTDMPRSHHLGILLLRVAPTSTQEIGWLVSNYALDLPVGMVPDVV